LFAQQIADALIDRGRGTATAAAYVKTTFGTFRHALRGEHGPHDSGHQILVVKVYGDFHPDHSVPCCQAPAPATVMYTVHDLSTHSTLQTSFSGGDAPDLTGHTDSTYADLRLMGPLTTLKT
jgi:hypothetical protein